MGEVLGLLLLLGLCVAILVVLPVTVLWWLIKWLKRENHQRAAAAVQILLTGFAIFWALFIYSFYFPFDSEFEGEFARITTLPFPESGQIMRGDESGLDPHGDYTICARIEVSRQDYEHVLKNTKTNSTFHPIRFATDSSFVSSKEFQHATKGINSQDYTYTFAKGQVNIDAYEFIGFLSDRRTIVVYRCST